MPDSVVRPSNEIYRDADGDLRAGVHITVSPEIFEQYRTGYRCIVCHTVQDEPFPTVCKEVYKDGGGCGFPIRDKQMDRIGFEFRGEVDLWPTRADDLGIWTPDS
jgi:hypothetical protein